MEDHGCVCVWGGGGGGGGGIGVCGIGGKTPLAHGLLWFLAMPLGYVNDGNLTYISKYFPIDILPTALSFWMLMKYI